jgi:hypothetical protein
MPAHARLIEVSPEGLRLQTEEPIRLAVGQRVHVYLPTLFKRMLLEPSEQPCEIVRISQQDGKRRISLRFLSAGQPWQQRLTDFIDVNKHRYKLDVADLRANLRQQLLASIHSKNARLVTAVLADSDDDPGPLRAVGIHQQLPQQWVRQAMKESDALPSALSAQPSANPSEASILAHKGMWITTAATPVSSEDDAGHPEGDDKVSDPAARDELTRWRGLAVWLPQRVNESLASADDSTADAGAPIQRLLLDQNHRRDERRYRLHLRIEVHIQGVTYSGETVDVSINGLKAVFQEPIHAGLRDLAQISFVRLQERYPHVQLTDQPYRIAAIAPDGRTLSFSRDFRFLDHDAAHFFAKLLPENEDKLDPCPDDTFFETLRSGYCDLLERASPTLMGIIRGRGSKARWTDLAYTSVSRTWAEHLLDGPEPSLACLTRGRAWEALLQHIERSRDGILDAELYLARSPSSSPGQNWQARWSFEFERPGERKAYIKDLAASAEVLFFRVVGGAVAPVDTRFMKQALLRLRTHSPKAYRDFLKENRDTAFCLHLVKMTDLIASRDG